MQRSEVRPVGGLRPPAGWPAGVRAVSTTRAGGVGDGAFATFNLGLRSGDRPETIAANRGRLRNGFDLPAGPTWLRQVHGNRVVRADEVSASDPPEADASWTDRPGTVCAVLTADCLPVVLAAADGSAVAVAHAGWRGLAAGVLAGTVDALPAAPDRIHAWLGPAIGPAAFEVGPEVRDTFLALDAALAPAFLPGSGDRWHADLHALAGRLLRAAGVRRISGDGFCTFHQSDLFFSHRREGPDTGRMATLAWRIPTASA